jgi:hypothetical protein
MMKFNWRRDGAVTRSRDGCATVKKGIKIMARNGKIARLPLHIRTELNRRLQDGEPGIKLLKWLNGLPAVRAALREYFGGVPISIQNLSEWRQGGYQDWVRLEAARDFIDNLSEQSGELDEAAGGELISDRFGSVLAAEMAQLAMKFLEQEDDLEKRWNRLKEINREFSRMRRDDHRGLRVWIKRAQWEQQQEQAEEAAEEKIRRQERVAAFFGGLRGTGAKAEGRMQKAEGPSGGGPGAKSEGRMQKAKVKRQKEKVSEGAAKPASSKTRKSEPQGGGQPSKGERSCGSQTRAPGESDPPPLKLLRAGQIKPNQTKSDQIKVNQTKPAKPGLPSETITGKPGVTIKVEGSGFKIEGSKPDEGPPDQNMPPLNGA